MGSKSRSPGESHAIVELIPALGLTLLALGGGVAAGYAPPATGQMAVTLRPRYPRGRRCVPCLTLAASTLAPVASAILLSLMRSAPDLRRGRAQLGHG